MGKVKPYERLDFDERKEYWVKYADGLAKFIQSPMLSEQEREPIYRELVRIFNIISLFDVPGGRIPKRTIESRASSISVDSIQETDMPVSTVAKPKVYRFRYNSRSKKFKKV